MVFVDEFIAPDSQIRSVLDYSVKIRKLPEEKQNYVAITGNYSVAGFEMTLKRKVSHYIITCYLPSGMFVIVSWISFLIPPDIVPGRMTLLITVFLVLVNIFNTITTNIPKAEGLTAIEAWVMVCVLFVFGALVGRSQPWLHFDDLNSAISGHYSNIWTNEAEHLSTPRACCNLLVEEFLSADTSSQSDHQCYVNLKRRIFSQIVQFKKNKKTSSNYSILSLSLV